MISLFMSIVVVALGVGRDEIEIVNGVLAGIADPAGIAKPSFVLVLDAVNVFFVAPIVMSPSISRSLKLLNPSGKVKNR